MVKVKLFCHSWVGLQSRVFYSWAPEEPPVHQPVAPLPVWTQPTQNVHLKHRRATSPLHRRSTWPWAEDATQLSHQTKAASVRRTAVDCVRGAHVCRDCKIMCWQGHSRGLLTSISVFSSLYVLQNDQSTEDMHIIGPDDLSMLKGKVLYQFFW